MRENVQELAVKLNDIFGDRVECQFIDIETDEIKKYPEIEKVINQVLFPISVIDGIRRSHGFLDLKLIINTVSNELNKPEQ